MSKKSEADTGKPAFNDLVIQGAMYKTTLSEKFRHRKVWKGHNPNLIHSFIPGTIISVAVKEGQKLKKGETLAVLEAMKMHNFIVMPFDGEVVKVNVQPNDTISMKLALFEVRPKL